MRILEIFDTERSTVYSRREFLPTDDDASRDNLPKNYIGRGSFSGAFDAHDDPHLITKKQYANKYTLRTREDLLADASDLYLDAVSDEQLWDNIHFPRVYQTKKYKDPHGHTLHKWKMERLEHMRSLDEDEIRYLGKRLFDVTYTTEIYELIDLISDAFRTPSTCKDDMFRDAVRKLLALQKRFQSMQREAAPSNRHNIHRDIHTGNIMVRRTPHGPQLVFSDPFVWSTR